MVSDWLALRSWKQRWYRNGMERETYLLEYIHHQLAANEAVGLKGWLAQIAEYRATWRFDLCRRLIRAIKGEKLSPLALGSAKSDKGLVHAQQGQRCPRTWAMPIITWGGDLKPRPAFRCEEIFIGDKLHVVTTSAESDVVKNSCALKRSGQNG